MKFKNESLGLTNNWPGPDQFVKSGDHCICFYLVIMDPLKPEENKLNSYRPLLKMEAINERDMNMFYNQVMKDYKKTLFEMRERSANSQDDDDDDVDDDKSSQHSGDVSDGEDEIIEIKRHAESRPLPGKKFLRAQMALGILKSSDDVNLSSIPPNILGDEMFVIRDPEGCDEALYTNNQMADLVGNYVREAGRTLNYYKIGSDESFKWIGENATGRRAMTTDNDFGERNEHFLILKSVHRTHKTIGGLKCGFERKDYRAIEVPERLSHMKQKTLIMFKGIPPKADIPHGNAKEGSEAYHRMEAHVMQQIRSRVQRGDMPTQIQGDILVGGDRVRNKKVVQNMRDQFRSQSNSNMNSIDSYKELINMRYDPKYFGKFIQSLSMDGLDPYPTVTLFNDGMSRMLKRVVNHENGVVLCIGKYSQTLS